MPDTIRGSGSKTSKKKSFSRTKHSDFGSDSENSDNEKRILLKEKKNKSSKREVKLPQKESIKNTKIKRELKNKSPSINYSENSENQDSTEDNFNNKSRKTKNTKNIKDKASLKVNPKESKNINVTTKSKNAKNIKEIKEIKEIKIKKDSKNTKTEKIQKDLKNLKKNKKDNRCLEVKTTQTGAFKQVIERIAGVISDCCLVFIPPDNNVDNDDDDYFEEIEEEKYHKNSKKVKIGSNSSKNKKIKNDNDSEEEEEIDIKPKKNKSKSSKSSKSTKKNTGGIRILRLTEDKSILIKLTLDASNFEYFRCDEPKITIGVDMHNLHALLKMVSDDDPIVMYMNRDNTSALYIRSLNENNESSEETDIEIYLMEIGNPEMPIPQTEFQNKIAIATDKFHTICKHMNNNSTFVEITSIGNEISFRGQNEGGKITMSYKDINYNKKKDSTDHVVQGLYELRNLMGFSKCNKLCNVIELYLKNDFPLVLVIHVATLGKMFVFLSPIEDPNN